MRHWVIPEKIHPPPQRMACWKFSQEGGAEGLEILAGGGVWTYKSSSGVIFNCNLDLLGSLTLQNLFVRSDKTSSLVDN